MNKPIKREILIDYTDSGSPRVLWAKIGKQKYILYGQCKRCGACCKQINDGEGCPHLTLDGAKYACGLGWLFPFGCRLFPMPGDEIEYCGLRWESK